VIVKKGLKKSYYKIERNLHSKVKGKILVSKTIKQNLSQNKNLHTYCTYDEFGVNNKENRLLKKALTFIKRYLPTYCDLADKRELIDTYNFINPAFQNVSNDIELNEIKNTKANSFYKEYKQATHIAKLILKRFAYNISNTSKDKIETPPFWIDMGILFELYVLGLLKDRFKHQVKYHVTTYGNELDFLLNTYNKEYQMVMDAKYKLKYTKENGMHHDDMRQVSGYARLEKVYNELKIEKGEIIDCLIIYPDQDEGVDKLKDVNLKQKEIPRYYDIYKLGIKLPYL